MQTNPSCQSPASQAMHIPTVSIGMPVYNGEKHIREALDSVLSQTFADFELIISDNASTDQTEAICRDYAKKDRRIRYVRQAENRGVAANFQFVLDEAVGEYFKWLAHDDFLEPTFLESTIGYLDAHGDTILCVTDVRLADGAGRLLEVKSLEDIRDIEDWSVARRKVLSWTTHWFATFYAIYGVYRLGVLRTHGFRTRAGFRGMLAQSEFPLLIRVALHGRIVALSFTGWTCRKLNDSVMRTEARHTSQLRYQLNAAYMICDEIRAVVSCSLDVKCKMSFLIMFVFVDLRNVAARAIREILKKLLIQLVGFRAAKTIKCRCDMFCAALRRLITR